MKEIPCGGVFLNEIAWIDSKPVTLAKKGLHQRGLPVNILELPLLLQEGLT